MQVCFNKHSKKSRKVIRNQETLKSIKQLITSSIGETLLAGEQFGSILNPGDIVLLKGNLGSGKTHFVKGVARSFHIPENAVQSPTFSLIHEYPGDVSLYHIDAYRLHGPQEALELGLEEYLYSDGICLIEWPEKIEALLPNECWIVEMKHVDENRRQISIRQQD